MKIKILGGAREVGRSAFLVENSEGRVLLDFGVQLTRPPAFPMHIQPREVDSILLSHAHLDHSGGIPLFFISGGTKLYTIGLTLELAQLLIEDFLRISGFYLPFEYIDLLSMVNETHRVDLNESVEIKGFTATFLNSGHLPGGASILLTSNSIRLLYTGDISAQGSALLRGADTNFGELDAVITESTYATTDHLPREDVEREFIEFAKEVVERGGTLFVPAFSVGRAQEIACVFKKYNFPHSVAMDGMALKTNEILSRYPEYLRDPKLFRESIGSIELIRGWSQRRRIVKTPSVIISPAGMLVGGAAVFYNAEVSKRSKNAIALVSYQMPETPGRILMEKKITIINGKPKKVKAEVRHFDFSSHSGRKELFDMFRKIEGEPKVYTVHGEEKNCIQFAEELKTELGLDAVVPKIGDTYLLK
ncbi:MAG: MBL fold metallo-hydrolase [Candidatus Methylarchaceae archaeon HK02M1]|nr:MBL fold metallo-hydrolase [Candidatus Methylarchaceae archaeon HK02M1]